MAEDTIVIQYLIQALLGDLGHSITIANDGKECVEYYAAQDFDVILMDVRMPRMDGMEATRIIRAMDGKKADIPIIAITADVAAGNISQYFACGVNDVCLKPLDLPVLLRSINNLLGEDVHISDGPGRAEAELTEATLQIDASKAESALNFEQILDRASDMADQQTDSGKRTSKMPGSADKWAKLLEAFEVELIGDCIELKASFNDLTHDPNDSDLKRDISMKTHSLKGMGGGYGYDLVTTVAGEVDELLKAEELKTDDLNIISNYIDALSFIANKKLIGDGGGAGRLLLQGLRNNIIPL